MKHFFLSVLALLYCTISFSQSTQRVKLESEKNAFEIVNYDFNGIQFSTSLSDISLTPQKTKNGEFLGVSGENLIKSYRAGFPELPVLSKLIEVPHGAKVSFEVISYTEQYIKLDEVGEGLRVIPAQPSVSKSDDPERIPFYLDEKIYKTDTFLNDEIAVYEEVGFMRATRLGRVEIRPLQYNPIKNTLRILNNLVVEVIFENPDIAATESAKEKYASPYARVSGVANTLNGSKGFISETPVTYVIVSDPMFQTALEPFLEWKRQKGFHVIEAYTNMEEVGNTTTSIKAYLKNLYENPATGVNPPSFVLLVGDVAQIPTFSGTAGDHSTDLYYFEYTNDKLPEVFYGRFSAQNESHLLPQIEKTLEYEKYLMEDPSYLTNHVLIAGVDGNYAPLYGNGHIRYAYNNYSNSENNINPYTYLYDNASESTTGIASNQSTASSHIRQMISEGVSWANYTAHCGVSGWGDPEFSTSQIANLTNEGKYGLWIGNCCQSNTFAAPVCFGEAALRAEGKGAIGYLGGSNNTYWDEDYFYGVGVGTPVANPVYASFGTGAYDAVFHTKANEVDNVDKWYITQGQVNVAGNLAVEASTSSRKAYYWEIYHLMGDPSVVPYLWVPAPIEPTFIPSVIIMGTSSIAVEAAPFAQVAISQDGVLVSVGITDENGHVDLEYDPSVLLPGDAEVVITAQNYQPYIGTLAVTPADEPYIILKSYSTSATPDFGQELDMNIVLKNISEDPYTATDVKAELNTASEYVNISSNSLEVGTIVWGQESTQDAAFTFTISDNVPDQTVLPFSIKMEGTYDSQVYNWTQNFTIKANAPKFSAGKESIDDDGQGIPGILDPAETANVTIPLNNIGHAQALDVSVELESLSEWVTVNGPTPFEIESLDIAATVGASFSISADEDTPIETMADFRVNVVSGNYTFSHEFSLVVGEIPSYLMGSSSSVTACIGRFYDTGGEGVNYSDSENSTMTFYPATEGNLLSFQFVEFKTEGSYDFLYVYDGPSTTSPQIGGSPFSGNVSPGIVNATNTAGALTFKFTSDNYINDNGWKAEFSCFDPNMAPSCTSEPTPAIDQTILLNPTTLSWDLVVGATSYDVYIGKDELPTELTANVASNTYVYSLDPNSQYFWKVVPKNNGGGAEGCPVWTFNTGELATIINMHTGTVTACNANFYDSGGEDQNYSDNENHVLTIHPADPSKVVSVTFSSFNVENGWDFLFVYNGTSTSAPKIGEFTGNATPAKVKASNPDGALTFKFTSDGSLSTSGWSGLIACEDPSYKISFEVVNSNQQPVLGAAVTLEGYSNISTNANGMAVFNNVIPESQIQYSISKESFHLAQGVVDVVNEDVYRKIVLIPLSDPEIDNSVKVYPNPFDNTLSISGISGVNRVVIATLIGNSIVDFESLGNEEISISFDEFPSGFYLVTLHFNSGQRSVYKVIKR